ncbi:MAG: CPBP family intramembrane metalloprotease [Archangium sp.]|nr:CPBP family intramembrane metalloprotease [Archangium sp.]
MTLRRAFALIGLFALLVTVLKGVVRFTANPENPYDSSPTFWVAWSVATAIAALAIVWHGSVVKAHGSWRAVFIAIGLQAAFVEESLFRGNLQPLLVTRFGKAAGLVLTAAIFSAYHLDPRPLSLAGKFVLGLVYGLARGTSAKGALTAPAFGHFLVWTTVGSF